MRAISLWQPWASLWCSDAKVHETRSWETRHRGWLLVHAAKKVVRDLPQDLDDIVASVFGEDWREALPRGGIVGRVRVIGCYPTEKVNSYHLSLANEQPPDDSWVTDHACGDFSPGRFAWERGHWNRFYEKDAIYCRGARRLFSVTRDVEEEVNAVLERGLFISGGD